MHKFTDSYIIAIQIKIKGIHYEAQNMSKIDIPEKLAIWQDDERQSKNTENTEKALHYNYFFREQYALNIIA